MKRKRGVLDSLKIDEKYNLRTTYTKIILAIYYINISKTMWILIRLSCVMYYLYYVKLKVISFFQDLYTHSYNVNVERKPIGTYFRI